MTRTPRHPVSLKLVSLAPLNTQTLRTDSDDVEHGTTLLFCSCLHTISLHAPVDFIYDVMFERAFAVGDELANFGRSF